MKVIYVVTQYLSFKNGRKSVKCVLSAFESEAEANNMVTLLSCSYDDYEIVASYEPIDLF